MAQLFCNIKYSLFLQFRKRSICNSNNFTPSTIDVGNRKCLWNVTEYTKIWKTFWRAHHPVNVDDGTQKKCSIYFMLLFRITLDFKHHASSTFRLWTILLFQYFVNRRIEQSYKNLSNFAVPMLKGIHFFRHDRVFSKKKYFKIFNINRD